MQVMYGQSASNASLLPGTTDVFAGALGVFLSGLMITVLHPRAKSLINYTIFAETIFNGAMISSLLLGCNSKSSEASCHTHLVVYISLLAFGKFAASTARTGNELFLLRSVSNEDKTMALGIFLTLKSVLGFIPYHHLFWWLVDRSCVEYKQHVRGQSGSVCARYDSNLLNWSVHGTAFGFMTLGTVFTVILLFYRRRLDSNLYEDAKRSRPRSIVIKSSSKLDPESGQRLEPLIQSNQMQVSKL